MNITGSKPAGTEAMRSAAVTQAMEWFVRHRAGDLSGADKQKFMQWLHASPLNVGEYLAAMRLAHDLPEVAARLRMEYPELLAQAASIRDVNVIPLASVEQQAPARRNRIRSLAAAVAIVAGVGAVLFWLADSAGLNGFSRVIEVLHGEQRTVQLRDGSVAHLNTDTRIDVRYSKQGRVIDLERGQALFQVARDAARPFRVRAGDTEVVAVGTEFEVYRKTDDEITVTVIEGKVDVLRHATGAARAGRDNAQPLRLQAGQQVHIDPLQPDASFVPVDVRIATAWVQREVVFDRRLLGEVADEFSRYSPVPILIVDPRLRELRVSGIFKAYDVESFVGYLHQFDDVAVERGPEAIRVLRREN